MTLTGNVVGIFISPTRGGPMQACQTVQAVAGRGLQGDRYFNGEGSWQCGQQGRRQVTIMNGDLFPETRFTFRDSRRNIFTQGIEVLRLIGHEFEIGGARFVGVKYCYPCHRPDQLSGKEGFAQAFRDRGCILADVIKTGLVGFGCEIVCTTA